MNKRVVIIIEIIIVNLITSIRVIGAFLLPFIYHKNGANVVSTYILVLFLTDCIDGFLARKLKVSTFFGSLMDASSDKLLNIVSFIILGIEYNIMFCPLIIEIAILYTTYSTYRYGGNVRTSKIGKIKTIILDILVIICFVVLSLPTLNINSEIINDFIIGTEFIIYTLSIIILMFCIITLFDYLKKNKIARSNPKCMEIKYQERKRKPIKQIIHELFDTEFYKKHKNESIMKHLYLD